MITDKTKKANTQNSKHPVSPSSPPHPLTSAVVCWELGAEGECQKKIELETSVKMSQTIEKPSDHRISIVAATSVAGANTTLCQL